MKYLDVRCVPTGPMLRGRDENVTIPVGTTQFSFTVPTDRGDLTGFDFTVNSSNLADLSDALVTLETNGVNIIENRKLLWHGSPYANKPTFIPVIIPGGSTFTATFVNTGVSLDVAIMEFFNGNRPEQNMLSQNVLPVR